MEWNHEAGYHHHKPHNLYKLYLNLNGDMASGEFFALSARGESWTGSFEGVKTA